LSQPASDPLGLFARPIARWFAAEYGRPTDVQNLAWPAIARGEHVLLTAPTGSGKTFAAFLWALDRLLTGEWERGATRVLYVSPLKALGNDIQRNLTEPLAELEHRFSDAGLTAADLRVESRTGDTPQSARRRMLRSPPEILVTTPETLNILLTSKNGRRILTGLRCVILDEVHAVAASKRGVHLITAVERLTELSGEFQRIALSATVRPLDRIARWVGGYALEGDPADPGYRPRPVEVVASASPKEIELDVILPAAESDDEQREPDSFWAALGAQLRRSIGRNRSTLIFGNARRSVEKVTRFINEGAAERLAYSHHGSLSREIRSVVEERLKRGELKAIVATSSLELGIDVGSIDEVVMIQTPPSVASTTQRLGRSGHGVGEISRGRLVPLLGRDLLEAAVVARCVLSGEIEELRPVSGALDVLAQVVLSMVVAGDRTADELYALVRASEPYHHLPRHHFDLVLQMLAGRYASTRLRSLRPMIAIDAVDGTLRPRPGAERLLYLSGGTIPDRGYYQLRIDGSGAPLGELDEEFVWERSVGDTFTLGVQTWRVERITHNDVLVSPARARSAMAPFWRADELDRSSFVSERMAALLADLEERLDDDGLTAELGSSHHLAPAAAEALIGHLREQAAATGCLPTSHRVVIEHTSPPAGRGNHSQMVLHTMWGGRVNRPFAAALSAAWERRYGFRPEVVHSADCVVLVYPSTIEIEDPFALVRVDRLEDLLRSAVERSGFFGARFREAAGCALLLPRAGPGRRVPLWVHRQRAKELLEGVREHDDFPLVLEAWRSCLQDEFELEVLRRRLDEVADGRVSVRHVRTEAPSPFTAQAAWKQTNELMYEDDVPTARARTRPDLVREMALAAHLRPRIDPALAADLESRLQRTAPGWSPRDPGELLEWVKERLLIPADEWSALLDAMARDHGIEPAVAASEIAHRAVMIGRPDEPSRLCCAVENLARAEQALKRPIPDDDLASVAGDDRPIAAIEARASLTAAPDPDGGVDDALDGLLAEWLRFYAVVEPAWISSRLGIDRPRLDDALGHLVGDHVVVVDELLEGADTPQICDRVNLERLLRMARAEARPVLEPLPASALPLLLAEHQKLGARDAVPEDLEAALEQLFGLPLAAEVWESEILPARLDPSLPGWLDALLTESDLRWVGAGERRIFFALERELDLFRDRTDDAPTDDRVAEIFPHPSGRFSLDELIRTGGAGSAAVVNRLWELAWDGRVTCDSLAPLRQGLASGFTASAPEPPRPVRRRGVRSRWDRWRRERPFSGSWMVLPEARTAADALAADEDDRERARIVLDRYGIVFRRLLERERPALRWGPLFRALRMLELGGEIVAGRFIDGVDGLQFATHETIHRLRDGLDEDRIWWLNAVDPASVCSLGIEIEGWPLPRRVPSNHLVFHGRRLVLVSERRGAELSILVDADHPSLASYLGVLGHLLGREERPLKSIDVTTINGSPAVSSQYRAVLSEHFHAVRQPTVFRLSRRF
jgi:ATP-dependent Lhr-like helicase